MLEHVEHVEHVEHENHVPKSIVRKKRGKPKNLPLFLGYISHNNAFWNMVFMFHMFHMFHMFQHVPTCSNMFPLCFFLILINKVYYKVLNNILLVNIKHFVVFLKNLF
jgi:hypothetical protein